MFGFRRMSKETNFVQKLESFVANLGNKFDSGSAKDSFEVTSSDDICENNYQFGFQREYEKPLDLSLANRHLSRSRVTKDIDVSSGFDGFNSSSLISCNRAEDVDESCNPFEFPKNGESSAIHRDTSPRIIKSDIHSSNLEYILQGRSRPTEITLFLECYDCGKGFVTFLDLTVHMIECGHFSNLSHSAKYGLMSSSFIGLQSHPNVQKRSRSEDCFEDQINIEDFKQIKRFKHSQAENSFRPTYINARSLNQNENIVNLHVASRDERSLMLNIPPISPFIVMPWSDVKLFHRHRIHRCSPPNSLHGSPAPKVWKASYNYETFISQSKDNPRRYVSNQQSSPLRNLESMVYGDQKDFAFPENNYTHLHEKYNSTPPHQAKYQAFKNLGAELNKSSQQPLTPTVTDVTLQKFYDYQRLAIELLGKCEHK